MRTWQWKFTPSLKWIRPFLPSYSVIAADTLRDLVRLTFDLLTLVSGHTWRVTCSTPPPSLKIIRLSVLELWVLTFPIGYHCAATAHAPYHVTYAQGAFFPTYFKSLTPICLFVCLRILRWCPWWRLGCRWLLEPQKKDSRVNIGARSRACAEAKPLIRSK